MYKRRCRAAFFIALLMVGAAAVARTPAALNAVPASQGRFDPEGSFFPLGNPPKALEEVGGIDLLRSARGRPFTSHAHSGVVTTNGVVYRFQAISVSRNNITFSTRVRGGTSYRFAGRFLRGGVYAEMDSSLWDQPMLEGTLTKLKNGKKVSESRMRFSYFGGT